MFCVGICDDSQEARLHLRARLERVLEPHRDMDRVLEFSSGEGLLRWVENHPGELNLIFLDMEMGQLDGMETARRLRLVRTQAVQQISGSQVLVGGQTLPISRSCQQAAMIALTRASLEE